MIGYVNGHDKKGRAVISLTIQESCTRFDRRDHLFAVEAGKTYTIGGIPKGVTFYDGFGEEIARMTFTKKSAARNFIIPKDCKKIGIL
ncbi:hypothetical protein [Planococcus beigongshangi]|uniref:hypothetical protein n=1 Tax=Planococcus beigongshangi TaxID=2782536 RepID=UPI00193C0F31|nr:hypothetical protein [Planococcus beigongshangi]